MKRKERQLIRLKLIFEMNRKQLASKLNMHPETFSKRLSEIGINGREILSPNQVEMIINTIANPLYFKTTRAKLAKWCCLHPETISKILVKIGIRNGKRLTIEDINKFFSHYGIPRQLENKYPLETKELRKKLGIPGST